MRRLAVSAVLMFSVLVAVGCGSKTEPAPGTQRQSTEPSKPAAAEKKVFKIAFSQCNSAEPYRTTQNNIMKRDIKKYPDCELVIQDAQQDNAKQIAHIENLILQGVDVLIVAPNEAAPITAPVKKAEEKSIKVVCLERNLLEPVYDIFVGADNVKIGEMAGEFVADYVKA